MIIVERRCENMEELAIIIDQNGDYMSFGKWIPSKLRDDDDPDVWHDKAFRKHILPTEWFQNLGIPYIVSDKIHFHNQLDVFARNGLVAIVNNSENDNKSIVLASPNTITDEQIDFLLSKKDTLINFENNNTSFIDVFDVREEYSIVESFFHIADYYDYLDKIIEERKQQTK